MLLTSDTMHMDSVPPQIVLDSKRLQFEIRRRGMSVTGLAEAVGIHRNTIGNYLSGKAGLPHGLSRILDALDLTPAEVLSWDRRRRRMPGLAVSELVSALHAEAPGAAFLLFGSRARGDAKPYSDHDLGLYTGSALEFPLYSRLLDRVAAWNEESLLTAQLVDLSRAEPSFLAEVAEDAVFLAGCHAAWCAFLRKAGVFLHD